jgi:hypothetical protein
LEYYGVKNAPFFINSALSLVLTKNENSRFGFSFSCNKDYVLPDYRNRVTTFIPHNQDNMSVFENNKSEIEEGIPVITGVDIYYLEYCPFYIKFHGDHRIILCGFSEDNGLVYLVDNYEWVFKGTMKMADFFTARSSECPRDESPHSGIPINNKWHTVDREGWHADTKDLVYKTICLTIDEYYNKKSAVNETVFYGIDALKKIMEITVVFNDVEKKVRMELITNLRKTVLFALSKIKLFRYYIGISSDYFKLNIFSELKEQLEEDVRLWSNLCRLIIKAMYVNDDTITQKIINKFNEIISIEEKRYDKLVSLKNSIQ